MTNENDACDGGRREMARGVGFGGLALALAARPAPLLLLLTLSTLAALAPGAAAIYDPGVNFTSPAGGFPNPPFDWETHGKSAFNGRNSTGGLVNSSAIFDDPVHFASTTNASVTASPVMYGNAVVVPSWDGKLRALRRTTGEVLWVLDIGRAYYGLSEEGGRISYATPAVWQGRYLIVSVSFPAELVLARISDGSPVWKLALDSHPLSALPGSGTVHGDRFYTATSSREAGNSTFLDAHQGGLCCSFVGSAAAVYLPSGRLAWKTPMIHPNVSGLGGFSGAGVEGSTPPVSDALGLVYFATGSNYNTSSAYRECVDDNAPEDEFEECEGGQHAGNHADSVVALDVDDGRIVFAIRFTPWSSWSAVCLDYDGPTTNCPGEPGDHYGFDSLPVLDRWCADDGASSPPHPPTRKRSPAGARRALQASSPCLPALYVRQQSGTLYCLNAADGEVIWANQTSPESSPWLGGGVGLAVDDERIYFGVANDLHLPWTLLNGTDVYGGGWAAHYKRDGHAAWTVANPANYDPTGGPFDEGANGRAATSWGLGAPAVSNDVVFVVSGDTAYSPDYETGTVVPNTGGWAYGLNTTDGAVHCSFELGVGGTGSFSVNEEGFCVGAGHAQRPGFLAGTAVYCWVMARP
jgi:polyvinyl alcohol dehydrogenase (cytochrome)